MAKEKITNPAVEYIASFASTPQAKKELGAVTQRLAKPRPHTRAPRITLSSNTFIDLLRPVPQLDRQVPLVALAQAVAVEQEAPVPQSITVYHKDGPLKGKPSTLFVSETEGEPAELPPTSQFVREGKLYESKRKLRLSGQFKGIAGSEVPTVLQEVPSLPGVTINCIPIDLYSVTGVQAAAENYRKARKGQQESRKEALDPGIWIDINRLAGIYDYKASTITKLLRGTVRTTRYQKRNYYDRDQAAQFLTKHLAEVRHVDGVYYRDGESKVTPKYLQDRYHVGYEIIYRELKQVVDTSQKKSGSRTFYPMEQAVESMNTFIAVPQITAVDGIYRDDQGKRWMVRGKIKDRLGVSPLKVSQFSDGVSEMKLRTAENKVVVAVDLDAVEARAAGYLQLPQAEQARTQHLVDASYLAQQFGLDERIVRRVILPLGVTVREKGTRTRYPEDRAETVLQAFIQFPEMDKTRAEIVHSSGKVYVTKAESQRRLHLKLRKMEELLTRVDIGFIVARSGSGFYQLFCLDDVKAAATQSFQPFAPVDLGQLFYGPGGEGKRITWLTLDEGARKTLIETKAQMLLDRGVQIRREALDGVGEKSFPDQVRKYYPGGMAALAATLTPSEAVSTASEYLGGLRKFHEAMGLVPVLERKIPQGNAHKINWREMTVAQRKRTIEKKARELASRNIKLTTRALAVEGESSFPSQVAEHYPGGMAALREVVGQKDIKSKRQWSKEKDVKKTLLAEVKKRMGKGKTLSKQLLEEWGLYHAVTQRYGYSQLREDLGLGRGRKSPGEWTPAKIRADVTAILKTEPSFSTGVAVRLGRLDLLNAISNYPGQMEQLLTDLSQPPNYRQWSEAEIEIEALGVYLVNGKITTALLDSVKGLNNATRRMYPGRLTALKRRVEEMAETLG